MSNYAAANTQCVINHTPVAAVVTGCQYENATGYLHARATVDFDDTLTSDKYSLVEAGTIGPYGAESTLKLYSQTQAYISACDRLGVIAVALCAADDKCRSSDN